MILRITCPDCKKQFSIEPTAAMREIERLKSENSVLRAKIAQLQQQGKDNPLKSFFGSMGL